MTIASFDYVSALRDVSGTLGLALYLVTYKVRTKDGVFIAEAQFDGSRFVGVGTCKEQAKNRCARKIYLQYGDSRGDGGYSSSSTSCSDTDSEPDWSLV
jgi:hypothetical protein